jgi:hypothetical protein
MVRLDLLSVSGFALDTPPSIDWGEDARAGRFAPSLSLME